MPIPAITIRSLAPAARAGSSQGAAQAPTAARARKVRRDILDCFDIDRFSVKSSFARHITRRALYIRDWPRQVLALDAGYVSSIKYFGELTLTSLFRGAHPADGQPVFA